MENENQNFFVKAFEFIRERRRVRAVRMKIAKEKAAGRVRDAELFLDDARLHGLDPDNNPRDLAVVVRAWMLKQGYFEDPGEDAWEERMREQNW